MTPTMQTMPMVELPKRKKSGMTGAGMGMTGAPSSSLPPRPKKKLSVGMEDLPPVGVEEEAPVSVEDSTPPSMAAFSGAETPDEEVREKSAMGPVDGSGQVVLAGKITPMNAGCFGQEVKCDMCAHYTGNDCMVVEGWSPEILGCVHLFKEADHLEDEMGEEMGEEMGGGGEFEPA